MSIIKIIIDEATVKYAVRNYIEEELLKSDMTYDIRVYLPKDGDKIKKEEYAMIEAEEME